MKLSGILTALIASQLIAYSATADEASLQRRIMDLEKRVATLEQRLDEASAKDRWKDPILWQRIKKGMTSDEIRKLLGKPTRVEQRIFSTWYYHPTSQMHSFVWLDEDKVLGWEAPD